MHLRRPRRWGAATVSAVSAGLALALLPASPASAATAPDWPTSRVPTGCASMTPGPDPSGFALAYTDTRTPTVTGWTYNGSKSRVVLPPGTLRTVFKVTSTQTCSGVAGMAVYVRESINGGAPFVAPSSLTRLSTNAFSAVFGVIDNSASADVTGWVEVPLVLTAPRYESFTLDANFGLLSKVDYTGGSTFLTGSWSTQRVYIVLATTQTTSASRAAVAKGGTVTFATSLKKASPAAYVALPGVAVKFQTKLPGKAWVTRATRTTSATGRATYAFKPGATMAWRWVRAENITTTPFTAASTSAARTIKVT